MVDAILCIVLYFLQQLIGGHMKASQLQNYGPGGVKFSDSVEKPTLKPDQVLVKVHAAGVNPFDWKIREGYMKEFIPMTLPATLGGDLAGTVEEIGEDVEGFAIGDEVFGQADATSGKGSYAEFAPVRAASLLKKPASLDYVTAAAYPLASSSAYQALVDHIGLAKGQKILIHGAAGGIGSFAVQIAHSIGAEVIATAGADDVEYMKALGASQVIDYKNEDFSSVVSGCDAVFDTVGGDTYVRSFEVLKKGGVLVSMVEQPDESLMEKFGVSAISQSSAVTQARLKAVAELIESGALKVKSEAKRS